MFNLLALMLTVVNMLLLAINKILSKKVSPCPPHGIYSNLNKLSTQFVFNCSDILHQLFQSFLKPIYIQRKRCISDIAPKSVTKRFPSDITATSQSLGVTVQHQNNRLDLGATSQRRCSRMDVNGPLRYTCCVSH